MTDESEEKGDLRGRLTDLQYEVTQNKGTERAFTGLRYCINSASLEFVDPDR